MEHDASEPFNIFSHRIDPRGVLETCRRLASRVSVVGPEDAWREIMMIGGADSSLRLRIAFSEICDRPRYLNGMRNYVSGFWQGARGDELSRVIQSFRAILSFPDCDLALGSGDTREAWVFELCRQLDGVVFTPTQLLDCQGRLIASSNGHFDAGSSLPQVPKSELTVSVELPIDDQEIALQPPTAERVAQRAIALAAIGNRGLIENELESSDSIEQSRVGMINWIQDAGVAHELEPHEWEVLQQQGGQLDSQLKIDAVWRLEGLGVLLWALGKYELPPYDELVLPGELFDVVGIYDVQAAREFIAKSQLRSMDDLVAYQTHALMTHWRFRDFSLRPGRVDFVAMSQECWIGTFDINRFRIENCDLAIDNREISQAPAERIQFCQSTASERHLAINWLLGEDLIYSETDTST